MDEPASDERIREIAEHRWNHHDNTFVDPALGAVLFAKATLMVLTLRELLELPPPEWEVDRLIPRGGITVLFGDGGTKKSFVALDWALRAALSLPWAERPMRPRRTLYVAAEGVSGMPDRVRAWAYGNQVPLDKVLAAPVWVYPQAVNLTDERATEVLIEMIRGKEVDRVVIDTLRRAMPGRDENSASDIGAVVTACDRIRVEASADLLVIHHSPASSGLRPRGSTSVRDDADVVLGMERVDAYTSRLFPSKLKDAAEFDRLDITFQEAFTHAEGEEERTSLYTSRIGPADEPEARPAKATAYEVLINQVVASAMQGVAEWSTKDLGELCPGAGGTVDRSISRAVSAGVLIQVGHGRYRRGTVQH